MNAVERIVRGFGTLRAAIGELRQEREKAARHEEELRRTLVTVEMEARSLAIDALRARRPRHLKPFELAGPRRPIKDGPPATPGISPVDEKTQYCLQLMGLRRATPQRQEEHEREQA